MSEWEAWDPDPEGALAMSKQLTDGFGRAVKPDGMAVGTCLSCKVRNLTRYHTIPYHSENRGQDRGGMLPVFFVWFPYV